MLTQRTFIAGLWSGADVIARQAAQFVIAIILARLLTPAEFGTVAVLYLFTGIASVLADSGFSAALTQRQDTTREEESAAFWFSAAAGLIITIAFAASAPLVAALYGVPVLRSLTVALALTIFITSLGAIHTTLLTKRTEFRKLMKISVASVLASGAVAIAMAWNGFGVWALAAQALTASGMTTLLLWLTDSWRPMLRVRMAALRRLWSFSRYVLFAAIMDVVYTRGYLFLIGRFSGVRELGLYDRAEQTKQVPLGAMSSIFSRVALPVFSIAAGDPERLRRGVQKSVRSLMLLNVPVMAGIAATARPAVLTLFGAPWLGSAPILQVLCLAGILWPLHVINLNALLAQGHSNLYFRVEVMKKAFGLISLIVGVQFGVMGVAWSQVAYGVAAFLINAHYTSVHLQYGWIRQTRDALPVLAAAGVMAAGVFWLERTVALPAPRLLLLEIAAGALLFGGFCAVFRLKAFHELIELARGSRSANQRFLHVVIDDKFLDDARDAFESVAPGQSEYVQLEGKRPLRFIRTFEPRLMPRQAVLNERFLSTLPDYEAVFIHYMSERARVLVSRAPRNVNFVWLGWGGDYYHLIGTNDDLLLPRTRALRATMRGAPQKGSMTQIARRMLFPRLVRAIDDVAPGGPGEEEMLDRIRWFVPVLRADYDRVARAVPGFSASYAKWNYTIPAGIMNTAAEPRPGPNILVGNSATWENNHLDAFELLRDAGGDRQIICPLSYGDAAYGDAVEREGAALFRSRFVAMRSFVPPAEYSRIVRSCSYAVMNHVRQQALGNVLIVLLTGARVYLRRENPIYDFLLAENACLFEMSTLRDDLRRNAPPLTAEEVRRNREVVFAHFGPEAIRAKTAALLETVTARS